MTNDSHSRILFNSEYFIAYYPKIGKLIGRNEAMLLALIHYWQSSSKPSGHVINGIRWIYNSYNQWQDQCCDMSTGSIKRAVKSLSEFPLIAVTNKFNSMFGLPSKTNWYTIIKSNFELFEAYLAQNKLSTDLDKNNLAQWIGQYSHYPMGQIVSIDTLYNKENITEKITYTPENVFVLLQDTGFSKNRAHKILQEYPREYILQKLRIYHFVLGSGKKIKNPCGFIIEALDKDYTPTTEHEKVMEDEKRFNVRAEIRQSLWENLRNQQNK